MTDSVASYSTSSVSIAGSSAIVDPTGKATFPIVDSDYWEFPITTKGSFGYSGTVRWKAALTLTKIAGVGISLTFSPDIFDHPYTGGTVPAQFTEPKAHIVVPNIQVPQTLVEFGQGQLGTAASKNLTIENTGEAAASLFFCSSNTDFSVSASDTVMSLGPKSSMALQVKYTRSGPGVSKGTIYVRSNDPDSSMISIPVSGESI